MFSRRSQFERQPNPLSKLLERQRKQGKKVIDLTESNPTRCHFTYPSSWLKSLSKKENLFYEPDPKGSLDAREAIAKYYRQLGVALDPEQIFLTSSSSEAYHFLFSLLLNPGDHLLLPAPGYPLIDPLGRLNDIAVDSFDLEYAGMHWKIDFDSLARGVHERTGAILLVHPNNPTGSYVDREDQRRLNALAKREHLPIISDEVFFDYLYSNSSATPKSFSARRETLTFTLNGLSKMLSLPQMKLSWIVVTGPKREVKEAIRRLEIIADTYLSVNTPVQNGLGLFLEGRRAIQSQVMKRVLQNRFFLSESFKEKLPAGEIFNSEGGWYATIRLPRIMTDEKWAMTFLKKEGVLVYPGHFFDFPMESSLIVSLLPPEPLFKEGIEKIVNRISYSLSIIG
jgi:alanine-synthesizing transaminase